MYRTVYTIIKAQKMDNNRSKWEKYVLNMSSCEDSFEAKQNTTFLI